MPNNAVGAVKVQLPVAKPVGATHAPTSATAVAAVPVVVPPPTPLVINGRTTQNIDVRTMTAQDVVNTINAAQIPGVSASVDGQGRLIITGIFSLGGDGNLRGILGI